MSLLDDIRSDLVNESASLSNTLRKAKILASALGLPEFRDWIDFELGGYPDRDSVPSYRRFRPTNLGTFAGPFQSGVKNIVLPTFDLPDTVKEFAENLIFRHGVGALEAQASSSHQWKWPQEMVMLAQNSIQMTGDYGSCRRTPTNTFSRHLRSPRPGKEQTLGLCTWASGEQCDCRGLGQPHGRA